MKFTHAAEVPYYESFRTNLISGMFDVPAQEKLRKEWEVDMPFEDEPWDIGVIVGPSGSGKSTICRRAFPEATYFDGKQGFQWSRDKAFVDDFPKGLEVTEITGILSQIGFSSPPSWILPFDCLSTGQKFRVEAARILLEAPEVAVIDEFTSVVDRQVAKVCSYAVSKFVRKRGKKLVAVSCHYDIVDWLEPDWVYHVDTGEFVRRGNLRRPPIKLSIEEEERSIWPVFRGHHYMSADLTKTARCFVARIEGRPVGFCAAIFNPHAEHGEDERMYREHRLVVLPDYQGIGIGTRLSDLVAQFYIDQGFRYSSTTSHPALAHYRNKSPRWKETRKPGRAPAPGKNSRMGKSSNNRLTTSHEYVAPKGEVNSCLFDTGYSVYAKRMYLAHLAECFAPRELKSSKKREKREAQSVSSETTIAAQSAVQSAGGAS